MISYEEIPRNPQVAKSLIGMSLAEFEELYSEVETAHNQRQSVLRYTRRDKVRRQRAVGAGRKHKHALQDRLLMTLFWLRIHTTYEVLGLLFGVDKTTAARDVKEIYETLAGMPGFEPDHLQADVPKLHSVQEVIDALPDIQLVLHAGK